MNSLYPVILFAVFCGIASGQRLTKPFVAVHTSDDASASESARKKAAFQAAPGRQEIIADINLPKLSGSELASMYRACAGRRVLVTAAAATAEFSLVFEASQQHPVTYSQAAELIRKSATVEGFTFTPHEVGPNLDVLTLAKGIPIIRTGVPVYTEKTPPPEGDVVLSYVMTLKYLEPNEAVAIFTKTVGKFEPFGSVAVLPGTSIIVATHRTSIIRLLVSLKDEIDKPRWQIARMLFLWSLPASFTSVR